jgi:hypothetical protein
MSPRVQDRDSNSLQRHVDTDTTTKTLILAMAPIETVLDSLEGDKSNLDSQKSLYQDVLAYLVESCWNDFGPSPRYLKRLVLHYVKILEQDGVALESNVLSQLVLKFSLGRETIPDSNESCYLSFPLPPLSSSTSTTSFSLSSSRMHRNETIDRNNEDWMMRIRVFPYHNNVALRLWEAGAAMAEFFMEHPFMVRNQHVIELGAGVGLTGLVIAGYCRPARVYLTDYTDVGRSNLQHNLSVNRSWLLRHGISPNQIAQVRKMGLFLSLCIRFSWSLSLF